MSELDLADPDGMGRVDTVLVSVAPPDGPMIAAVLRDRGFAVIEAPLQLLGARALGMAPTVAVVDLDPPGALDAVRRARAASPSTDLLYVGAGARAAELGLGGGRSFERPLDLDALAHSVGARAEPALDLQPLGASPGLKEADDAAPSAGRESDVPEAVDSLDSAAILPSFDDADGFSLGPPLEVSPELAQILEAAEQRMSEIGEERSSGIPSPENEPDILLPAELLASLDEPLDPEEGAGTGASGPSTGGGTGPPKVPTTGAKDATTAQAATGIDVDLNLEAPPPPSVPPPEHERTVAVVMPHVAPSRPSTGSSHAFMPAPRATSERVEPSRQPAPPPSAPETVASRLALPAVLGEGDALRALALAIAGRASGALELGTAAAVRRIVLHDGDVVTAASTLSEETLVAFLAARGDIERAEAVRLGIKLPGFGRHAGAALIAHGILGQDDLWPVLRAHAEWILGRAIVCDEGTCALAAEPPGRLKAEPNVFGGATGAEVLLEAIRRAVPPEVAAARLGGPGARVAEGQHLPLLAECALRPDEEHLVRSAAGRSVGDLLAASEPELADVLYGLVVLGVLDVLAPARAALPEEGGADPLDQEAIRQRVRARVALVQEGDYFALLGVPCAATGYEIRRAYLELRRSFEPGRLLTAATADLVDDLRVVLEVLDEAYEILRDERRRERYRKAIEAGPP